jgi:tetratricopeptide (TPR) repeat protein
MTESTNASQDSASFCDQMEILQQELELAIHWQRPCVMMVEYSSEYVRADAVSMLENFLMDRHQQIVWIHAGNSIVNSLAFWYRKLDGADQVVFFLEGFGDLKYQRGFKAILNQHAYLFAEKNARLVCWFASKEASLSAYEAPLLWAGRNRFIELVASPKPEQILQRAVESAWQATGENDGQFERADNKTSVRESFLMDLLSKTEATSERADLLLTLGILHWRKGDHEKANEMLQSALQIATRMHDTWFEAECCNALALVKSSLFQYEEAIDAYKQAIGLAPDQIFAWNNLGNLCLKTNRNDEALMAFQKTIEHDPADGIAWNGIGDVYSRSESVDDAITAYRKSIECAPSLSRPWNGLGEICAHSGRLQEAVIAFQEAITRDTHCISPWLGLAHVFERQQRHSEAAHAYQQALSLEPRNTSIWNGLGCVYLEAGRYDEAAEALAKAVELDRGFGWAYSNLALAHAHREQPQESILFYRKSLELLRDPEHLYRTWNRMANAYCQVDDDENAIKAHQMADSLSATYSLNVASVPNDPEPSAALSIYQSNHIPGGFELPINSGKSGRGPADASLDQTQDMAVSDAESALETGSNQPEEPGGARPIGIEVRLYQPESDPEVEASLWIFQSAQTREEVSVESLPSVFSAASSGSTIAQPETVVQEIGGLSMQMTLPFFSKSMPNQPALFRPEELFEVDSANVGQSSARTWNEKGNVLFRAGSYEAAIRVYNKAIQLDRSFGWSYCNLGITYLQLKRYAEAILLLQKSLELLTTDTERAIAWNELGNLYRSLSDYHNASAAYQKADELDPDHAGGRDTVEYLHAEPNSVNVQIWSELGDMFFKACSHREASDCYRKVVEMEPLNGMAHRNLAMSLTYQARFAEAVPYYLRSTELLQDDKKKADNWNQLGNVYRRLNDYDKAIAAYRNAVQLNHEQDTLLTRARFSLLGNCYVD